jgi:hypothetical protein
VAVQELVMEHLEPAMSLSSRNLDRIHSLCLETLQQFIYRAWVQVEAVVMPHVVAVAVDRVDIFLDLPIL